MGCMAALCLLACMGLTLAGVDSQALELQALKLFNMCPRMEHAQPACNVTQPRKHEDVWNGVGTAGLAQQELPIGLH